MIHPSTEVRYINRDKGYGLFATQSIPQGTVTWVRDRLDREITPVNLMRYDRKLRETIIHFSYRNNLGNFIFCWDNARYINHDCNPNTSVTAYELEIAIRDINKNDEITNHYGMLNIIAPFTLPKSGGTIVSPHDLLTYGLEWDKLLQRAFPQLARVDQPLRPLISDILWADLEQISNGNKQMESVISCYFTEQMDA